MWLRFPWARRLARRPLRASARLACVAAIVGAIGSARVAASAPATDRSAAAVARGDASRVVPASDAAIGEADGGTAGGAGLAAVVTCDASPSIGRVRCEARATVEHGRIAWGDVVVVRAPAFVSVLRGRIAPAAASEHDRASWRWPFGLVARERGEGDVEVRVRAVVCDEHERCAPVSAPARTEIVVR